MLLRAGTKHIYIPGGSLGVRACSAGEIGGAGGVTSTRSVSFDGTDDYIRIPRSATHEFTTAMTVAAWVKYTSDSSYRVVVTKSSASTAYSWYLNVGPSGDGVAAYFGAYFGVVIGLKNAAYSTAFSGWHHLCGTYDGSNLRFYFDGVLSATTPVVGTIASDPTVDTTIGNYHDVTTNRFLGLIDDVRLYSIAIDSTDVANLAAGVDVTTGLVAYWPLEEGSGTNTVDTIGGNNGTLTNGPTWSTDVPAPLA